VQHRLVLYGKAGCHLCEEAQAMLQPLQREYGFDLTEIDILSHPALEAQYRYDIPVIVIDDDLQLSAPLHERELRALLSQRYSP
jgi:glutaredoxin